MSADITQYVCSSI